MRVLIVCTCPQPTAPDRETAVIDQESAGFAKPRFRALSAAADRCGHRVHGLRQKRQALTESANPCCRIDRAHQPGFDAVIQHDSPELSNPWSVPVRRLSERARSGSFLAVVRPMLGEWLWAPKW
jgi:hypothetical protein